MSEITQVGNTICERASKLRNELFDKTTALFMNFSKTNIVFNLHLQRMSQRRYTTINNPSYKAMIELYKECNKFQKESLLSLLNRKLKFEKEDSKANEWENLINKIEESQSK